MSRLAGGAAGDDEPVMCRNRPFSLRCCGCCGRASGWRAGCSTRCRASYSGGVGDASRRMQPLRATSSCRGIHAARAIVEAGCEMSVARASQRCPWRGGGDCSSRFYMGAHGVARAVTYRPRLCDRQQCAARGSRSGNGRGRSWPHALQVANGGRRGRIKGLRCGEVMQGRCLDGLFSRRVVA